MSTSVESITIATDLDGEMRAHLEAAYPNEGCGIMIGTIEGRQATLMRVVCAENQNKERGQDRFEIDPLFYYKTEQGLANDEQVIGFFHSHPDCPEIASETDRTFALNWPDFIWVIYRVDAQNAVSVRSWIIDDATQQFVEMSVAVETAA